MDMDPRCPGVLDRYHDVKCEQYVAYLSVNVDMADVDPRVSSEGINSEAAVGDALLIHMN